MEEEWRWVEGFEGRYEVSNTGNVRSYCRNAPYFMGLHLSIKKYYRVCLTVGGKNKNFYVHRLVASAFIPNPQNKKEVNHIDSVRLNNAATNLEWVTPSENMKHACAFGKVIPPRRKTLTHCANGHPFVPEFTTIRIAKNGKPYRLCKICKRITKRQYYLTHGQL